MVVSTESGDTTDSDVAARRFLYITCMLVSVSFLLQVIALVGGSHCQWHDTSQSSPKHSDWQDSDSTRIVTVSCITDDTECALPATCFAFAFALR